MGGVPRQRGCLAGRRQGRRPRPAHLHPLLRRCLLPRAGAAAPAAQPRRHAPAAPPLSASSSVGHALPGPRGNARRACVCAGCAAYEGTRTQRPGAAALSPLGRQEAPSRRPALWAPGAACQPISPAGSRRECRGWAGARSCQLRRRAQPRECAAGGGGGATLARACARVREAWRTQRVPWSRALQPSNPGVTLPSPSPCHASPRGAPHPAGAGRPCGRAAAAAAAAGGQQRAPTLLAPTLMTAAGAPHECEPRMSRRAEGGGSGCPAVWAP